MNIVAVTPETFGPTLLSAFAEASAADQEEAPTVDSTVRDFRANISPEPEDYASLPPEMLAELGLSALKASAAHEAHLQRTAMARRHIEYLLGRAAESKIHVNYIGDPELESPIIEEVASMNSSGLKARSHPNEATGTGAWISHSGDMNGILYLNKGRFHLRRYAINLIDPLRPVSLSIVPGRRGNGW